MAAKRSGAGAKKTKKKSAKPEAASAKKTPKRAPAVSRPTPARRAPRAKASGATKQEVRAKVLAAKMPLVHYPASTRLEQWIGWPDGLICSAARGQPIPTEPFAQLRATHVFFYGGPCCYYKRDGVGDAVLYFDASAEEGRSGGVSPFDSGALEDPTPKLRPWSEKSLDERWGFFQTHALPLSGWRARFERWLAEAYDEPDRYLQTSTVETGSERWQDGQPHRLTPAGILEHNGSRGYDRYGAECADRRAWTWEVRIAERMPFAHVRAIHVPVRKIRKAREAAHRLRWASGFVPEVMALRRGVEATPDTLYAASGNVLKELIGE